MRLIDADDLYQKCIEIQLKKRNRYFDIDDVIKLIKKAPTVEVLDKIRAEIEQIEINGYIRDVECFTAGLNTALNVINKYRKEVSE